jgi:hypothetical protein
MILFVTGQYAGAQYIHPLLKKWKNSDRQCPQYNLVATGTSLKYWLNTNIKFDEIIEKNSATILEYLDIVKPKLIILSASAAEELEYLFILNAKLLDIKTASFIDTWTNYKNRYIYNGKEVYPDIILSIDKKCTEEMIKDGISAEIIQEIGQPYLEEFCENIPPLGERVLLAMQPIKNTRGNGLGYNEEDFLKLTLSAVKEVCKNKEIHITLHPDNSLDTFKQKDIEVTEGQGIEDIKKSHTVLGMFSMQMIIAYLWDRRVASVQPKLKGEDPFPLSRWQLVPKIENRKELIKFMNSITDKNSKNQKEVLLKQLHGSLDRLDQFCKKELI